MISFCSNISAKKEAKKAIKKKLRKRRKKGSKNETEKYEISPFLLNEKKLNGKKK